MSIERMKLNVYIKINHEANLVSDVNIKSFISNYNKKNLFCVTVLFTVSSLLKKPQKFLTRSNSAEVKEEHGRIITLNS